MKDNDHPEEACDLMDSFESSKFVHYVDKRK